MRTKLARTLLIVLGLLVIVVVVMVWKTMPNTVRADGFSLGAFQKIRVGDPESTVIQELGRPLATFSEEHPEQWCFGEATHTAGPESSWLNRVRGHPDEADCFFLKQGVVQGVRRGAAESLDALIGKTTDELEKALGKPTYTVPEGTNLLLRYSAPKQPTDAYEVFLVVLDHDGLVRGTQRYFYRD